MVCHAKQIDTEVYQRCGFKSHVGKNKDFLAKN